MAKEVEAKILEVDPKKVRAILKRHGAKQIMPRNKQSNIFYSNQRAGERISKIGTKPVIRIRKDHCGWTMAIKSELKVVKGRKVMSEFESKVENGLTIAKGLEMLGMKKIGHSEVIREDWTLQGCQVSLMTFPGIPTCMEIEGMPTKMRKVAALCGYSEKDYVAKTIYEYYNIKTGFLTFR